MITKSNISSFPDILNYFKAHVPNSINIIATIPILKISSDLWNKFKFKGYGYVVRKDQLLQNQMFLEAYSNINLYNTLPTDEHKRDINIYKLLKQLSFPDIFIIVLDSQYANFFILHELSHLCGIDQSFNYNQKFNDEYLDSKEEQSAYYSEMKYAKQSNMSFEEYFKNAHPNEYQILTGNQPKNTELYNLALMDKNDYKRMWENVV